MDEQYEENLELLESEVLDYTETCHGCGRFFTAKMIKIGRGVCIRCAGSGHEPRRKKKRRYKFISPEVESARRRSD